MISSGIFESLNNMTIYVKGRGENNELSGITLHDSYDKESSITLTAQDGDLVQEDGEILMRLRNGTLQRYNYAKRSSQILSFDSYVVNLSQNRDEDYRHIWKEQERYINELLYPKEEIGSKQMDRFRVEVHQRLTYPLFSIIFALIACSYVLRGEFSRKGSFGNVIGAIVTSCIFLTITMTSYDLMEKSSKYTILLYGNFIFFAGLCIYLLKSNFRKFR
jgi:lipopolysaccharide export system permease protein